MHEHCIKRRARHGRTRRVLQAHSAKRTTRKLIDDISIFTGRGAQNHGEEHPKFDVDVPQFSDKIGEKVVRLEPRLYRRGVFGQPKQIVNTKLGQGDVAEFTVDNVFKTVNENGCGDTPEEKGQEALDKLLRYATKKPRRSRITSTVRR